jgi:hypothetical protein
MTLVAAVSDSLIANNRPSWGSISGNETDPLLVGFVRRDTICDTSALKTDDLTVKIWL